MQINFLSNYYKIDQIIVSAYDLVYEVMRQFWIIFSFFKIFFNFLLFTNATTDAAKLRNVQSLHIGFKRKDIKDVLIFLEL